MLSDPLWTPDQRLLERARVSAFMQQVHTRTTAPIQNFHQLWDWSCEEPEQFWSEVWDFCEVIGEKGDRVLLDGHLMPGASWFPDARLNFAENLLGSRQTGDALVFWGEDRVQTRVSHQELEYQVACCQQALREVGVGIGDRVAGFLPNMPETIIAMLATASLGAVWCSASPDFGINGVRDRFGQIEPKVLFCVDGYYYDGKALDCTEKNAAVAASLPSLEKTVVVSYLHPPSAPTPPLGTTWKAFVRPTSAPLTFERLPFDHPLYIMFSSGTTGAPKCIVHSAGGTLIQHLKEHQLHADIRPGDRLFYFTTCGWMMWNWLVSGLASGATLLLYDGNPFVSNGQVLFDFAATENMTQLGTSAKFLEQAQKLGLQPNKTHDLAELRSIFSTGSPLSPQGFDYVYTDIKPDVLLASISGGTDIISCFALGSPLLPVYRSELQTRGLGMAVDVYDEDGKSIQGLKGELVCKRAFPSMPIGFWNDAAGEKFHSAYFDRFENTWCHGDFVELTANQGMIIYGRSDTVLNPGGVRIGTAEIYRQVETIHEVMESIAVGQEWDNDVRVVLFVKLRENTELTEALETKIKKQIRANATPRHVPAVILAVADIPRTKSGKIVELAVRDLVHGRTVANVESLANPEALEHFKHRIELS